MKSKLLVYLTGILILFVVIQLFTGSSEKQKQKPEFRNFYGIAWNGSPHDNLAFARQMVYDYVFYQKGMEKDGLRLLDIVQIQRKSRPIYWRRKNLGLNLLMMNGYLNQG